MESKGKTVVLHTFASRGTKGKRFCTDCGIRIRGPSRNTTGLCKKCRAKKMAKHKRKKGA